MRAGRLYSFKRACLCSATSATLLIASSAYSQTPPLRGSVGGSQGYASPAGPPQPSDPASPRTSSAQGRSAAGGSIAEGSVASPLSYPTFRFGATVTASESYVSNARGLSGSQRPDYVTTLGLRADLHQHSRRVNLDALYAVSGDYYARHSVRTQIYNHLQLLGSVDAIPDYLTISGRAFAQPVVVSDLGIVTADNRVVPDGFRNSFGYSINPDLRFRLGDFAVSDTMPSFGQVFFTTPRGSSNIPVIPGLLGPRDTTMRSLTQRISSGPYFSRLNWSLIGAFSEVDRPGSLLSEKAGLADVSYAVGYTFSLLATAGYDSISNSTPLNKNLSGPVAMGGFGLNFGPDFALKVQAGTKYNSFSFNGNLRYNITPTSTLIAYADDYVQTPEGQLLNNLTNLTALDDGTLASRDDIVGDGFASSFSSYNIQSQGSFSLNRNISRYQIASLSFLKEFERSHVNLRLYGTRRTMLDGVIIGRETVESGGAYAQVSRDLTPLLVASLGGGYTLHNEFGGETHTIRAQGQLHYSLSRQTRVYLRSVYLERDSSAALTALSPFAGSTDDLRVTIGLAHSF